MSADNTTPVADATYTYIPTFRPLTKPAYFAGTVVAQAAHDAAFEHAQKIWAFCCRTEVCEHLKVLLAGTKPSYDSKEFVRFCTKREYGTSVDDTVLRVFIDAAVTGTDPSAAYGDVLLQRQARARERRIQRHEQKQRQAQTPVAVAPQTVATTELVAKPVAVRKPKAKKPVQMTSSTSGSVVNLGMMTEEEFKAIRGPLQQIKDKTGRTFLVNVAVFNEVTF